MSDDEDYYDDDDYIYYEDAPYAEADDLAEHTMHSPVLIDYDPSFDTYDALDESELYPSDFFDEDIPRKRRKRSREKQKGSQIGGASKRRQLEATDAIPELSLGEPVTAVGKVIWRSAQHAPMVHPVVEQGQGAEVALLKDWRDRFKESAQDSFFKVPRKASQTMLAVVIERRPSLEEDRDRMPPPARRKSQESNAKRKKVEPKALANGTSGTASSLAKQRQKSSSSINGSAKPSSSKSAPAKRGRPPTANRRKRKASELDSPKGSSSNSEDELADDGSHSAEELLLPKAKSDLPLTAKAPTTGRKRKFPDREAEDLRPPAKRTASTRGRAKTVGGPMLGAKGTDGAARKGSRKK